MTNSTNFDKTQAYPTVRCYLFCSIIQALLLSLSLAFCFIVCIVDAASAAEVHYFQNKKCATGKCPNKKKKAHIRASSSYRSASVGQAVRLGLT